MVFEQKEEVTKRQTGATLAVPVIPPTLRRSNDGAKMSTNPPRTPKSSRRETSRVSFPTDPQVSLIPTMLGHAFATWESKR